MALVYPYISASQPAEGGQTSKVESPVSAEQKRMEKKTDWTRRLGKIREARAQRLEREGAPDPAASAPARVADRPQHGEDFDRITELSRQLQELLTGCGPLLPEAGATEVTLDATVSGEPDVGAVVESLDVGEVDAPSQEFADCIEQSIYALDFPLPDRGYQERYRFDLLDGERLRVAMRQAAQGHDAEHLTEPNGAGVLKPEQQALLDSVQQALGAEGRAANLPAVLQAQGFTKAEDGTWSAPGNPMHINVSTTEPECPGTPGDQTDCQAQNVELRVEIEEEGDSSAARAP